MLRLRGRRIDSDAYRQNGFSHSRAASTRVMPMSRSIVIVQRGERAALARALDPAPDQHDGGGERMDARGAARQVE